MDEIKITRCPACGGMHLKGVFDENAASRGVLSTFLKGGLIGLLFKRQENKAYWVCQDCGHVFPM